MTELLLTVEDVSPLVPDASAEKLEILIEDVLARARNLVPQLTGALSEDQAKAAKGIIRNAVARRADAGNGAVTTEANRTGDFSQSVTREGGRERPLFYQSELDELRALFNDGLKRARAFSIDMAGGRASLTHLPSWW